MADPFFEPDQRIAAIASINPVSPILPIVGIPRIAITNAPTGNEFRVDSLPAKVQELFNKKGNPWLEALDEAVLGTKKLKDLNLLADLIFFMQHSERMKDGVGKLIDQKADVDFIRLRAEWNHYRTIANCRLHPSTVPDVFLSEKVSRSYEDFVAKQTTGNITLMVNGRNRRGTVDIDNKVDAFDSMQQTVESLGPNDSIYLTAWQFNPILVPLTQPRPSLAHWGELFKKKAEEGVKIRIIITIHPDLAYYFNSDLAALEGLIYLVPPQNRDNFKFIASRHPAKESFPGLGEQFVGDHHQKFMVVKKGKTTIAYCGGLDISHVRTPNAGAGWSDNFVWHDIHAKLEGLIAKDIEREFVLRWNREKDKAKTSKIPKIKNRPDWKARMLLGWNDFEKLDLTPVGSVNKNSRNNAHKLQMLRTVSFGATIQDNKRDDIWQGYFKLIARAKTFLYLENQYFHEPKLADAIVKQMEAQSNLIVIIVVTTGTDDRPNEWYKHCLTVRHKFFTSLLKEKSISDRIGVYTMFYTDGIVHSKLILVDDQVLSIGSANANERGFFVDTELNVMLDHAETVKNFRQQLWSHNLGLPLKIVARWDVSDYISNWDRVADRNKSLEKDINKKTKEDLKKSLEKVIPLMVGEGIIRFDPLARKDPGSHDPKDPRSEIDIMQDMSLWIRDIIVC